MRMLAMLLGFVAMSGACHCSSPASGEKVGQIVKIEETGVVCKTHEAELIRGGLNDGTGVAGGQVFHFTIPPEHVGAATKAMEANQEVKLFYQTPLIVSMCKTNYGTLASKVEVIERK